MACRPAQSTAHAYFDVGLEAELGVTAKPFNALAVFGMAASGLQILRAFPIVRAKIPKEFWSVGRRLRLAVGRVPQWHLTHRWICISTGLRYLGLAHFQRQLQAGFTNVARDARSLADGSSLLEDGCFHYARLSHFIMWRCWRSFSINW